MVDKHAKAIIPVNGPECNPAEAIPCCVVISFDPTNTPLREKTFGVQMCHYDSSSHKMV